MKVFPDDEGYNGSWTGEEASFKPIHGEDDYTLPIKVKTKTKNVTTAEGVVLRGHHKPTPISLRSASVEDVSGTAEVSGPVRASMPPDAFPSSGLDQIDHDIPSEQPTLSPSNLQLPSQPKENLQCFPASGHSINKLQVTAPWQPSLPVTLPYLSPEPVRIRVHAA